MGGSPWPGVLKAKGRVGGWILDVSQGEPSTPTPALPRPGSGLGAFVALNWGLGEWEWTLPQKGLMGRPHLASMCFPLCSGKNTLISWRRVSEVKGIRSGFFCWRIIFSRDHAYFVFCWSSLSPDPPTLRGCL